MKSSRIYFPDNPWPEGHLLKEFVWSMRAQNGQIWFDFHLKSDNYYAERVIETEEDEDFDSAWESPDVWGNYHACTLSSTQWGGGGGFLVGIASSFDLSQLDGREFVVDDPPPEDLEENAFGIYLLGHDAVAQHRIKFTQASSANRFNIEWSGRVALAYVGDYDYEHAFHAVILDAESPAAPTALATLIRD
jgi:hypothetical protein